MATTCLSSGPTRGLPVPLEPSEGVRRPTWEEGAGFLPREVPFLALWHFLGSPVKSAVQLSLLKSISNATRMKPEENMRSAATIPEPGENEAWELK